jgi:ParB-like chromosome segregation protein Spo0J
MAAAASLEIQIWPIDRLVLYARNPRKNDAAVDRMCSSIREFGFKIPVLARSDGEVVDGQLRLKAARKLGIAEIPVLLCDEWTPQQLKAFRLMVNRSVTSADYDEDLLSLELQELNESDFDLSLTGFGPGEIDGLLAIPDEERANCRAAGSRKPGVPSGRLVDLRKASGALRRCNPVGGCHTAPSSPWCKSVSC